MTASDSKSYLGYLKRLVDKCNNTYHLSIGKKSVDGYSSKKLRRILELLNLKLVLELRLLSTRKFLAKGEPKIGQEKYLLFIVC